MVLRAARGVSYGAGWRIHGGIALMGRVMVAAVLNRLGEVFCKSTLRGTGCGEAQWGCGELWCVEGSEGSELELFRFFRSGTCLDGGLATTTAQPLFDITSQIR